MCAYESQHTSVEASSGRVGLCMLETCEFSDENCTSNFRGVDQAKCHSTESLPMVRPDRFAEDAIPAWQPIRGWSKKLLHSARVRSMNFGNLDQHSKETTLNTKPFYSKLH